MEKSVVDICLSMDEISALNDLLYHHVEFLKSRGQEYKSMIDSLEKVPSGDSVAEFTLAVNRKYGTQQADYIKCIVWRKMAENVYKYCSKGSTVGIEGKLQSRSYDNTQGHKVYVVEVICDLVTFINTKKSESQHTEGSNCQSDMSISSEIKEENI